MRDTFRRLTAELSSQPGSIRPRLHDLQHHFALSTVLRCYRDGEDVERRLPVPSAFFGHVEISDTYWYLSTYPEMLNAAKGRLERHWGQTS